MITLLKNLNCFIPRRSGLCDILVCAGKIEKIRPSGEIAGNCIADKTIECKGLNAFPGIIDQHVHIAGGGGENGFASRISRINANDIFAAGVTTVCGLLGADGTDRSLTELYATAKQLEAEGITTFVYSGSYSLPPLTFTGDITRDLVIVDKVIGAGEIAVSDHRSSQPGPEEIAKLASKIHLGGLLSGKAGVIHIHLGEGKGGLAPVFKAAEDYDLPREMFVPTHLNRSKRLLCEAGKYAQNGGNTDFTAGEEDGVPVPIAVCGFLDSGIPVCRVTISSDANGSIPGGGAGKIQVIYDDVKRMITDENILPETAFGFVTENVAKLLKLYPKKGALREGSDADILLTDADYNMIKLFCGGVLKADCTKPQAY